MVKPGHLTLSCLTIGGTTIQPTVYLPQTPYTPTTPTTPTMPRTNPVYDDNGVEDEEARRRRALLEEDPDFDPDNVVIRGEPLDTDEEDVEDDGGDHETNGNVDEINTFTAPQQLAFSNVVQTRE